MVAISQLPLPRKTHLPRYLILVNDSPKCSHHFCVACLHMYVRSALGSVATDVKADGLHCPMQCGASIQVDKLRKLVGREVREDMKDVAAPISEEEVRGQRSGGGQDTNPRCACTADPPPAPRLAPQFDRLERFLYEAAIPHDRRFYCKNTQCTRMFEVSVRILTETDVSLENPGSELNRHHCLYCD